VDGAQVARRMGALQALGDPYTAADIAAAPAAVKDRSELDALVTYLQGGIRRSRAAAARRRGETPMSSGWSWFVIALVVLNVAGCLVLLWYTSRPRKDGTDGTAGTGHVWDGDLSEYDKPLPRWWINLFYITIVFTVAYLVIFPGFGAFTGTEGWTSQRAHDADKAATTARLAETFRPYEGQPIDVLARDPSALKLGRAIFGNNCATCHGSLGQGAIGYPDLTDQIWHWGGTPDDVLHTVLQGRNAQMPPWATTLKSMGGDNAVDDVATYVLSLTDPSLLATNEAAVARGGKLFANVCVACHGPNAKGNPQLGAPDLTDAYWLYGRSRAAIRTGLEQGRNGVMPAHAPLLGETRARLAAAYAWSLSHTAAPQP
jgi:cytochrome c oxidase cbb3-type subunit 3